MGDLKITIKFGFCVQTDGLDVEGLKKDLEEFGTVFEIMDNEIIEDDGSRTPVKIYFIETDKFLNKMLCKRKYNCVEDNYMLFPMAEDFDSTTKRAI